eukprot:comp17206_c5_seq1/m.16150 comp17206_c5_seq1/g.16150  ORF comp17206_c5_seq1/g.16150 comp17206_c5_seq1/m.16150 type:complete len:138 (+) comp17206_c5_seq1:665-1078(+)
MSWPIVTPTPTTTLGEISAWGYVGFQHGLESDRTHVCWAPDVLVVGGTTLPEDDPIEDEGETTEGRALETIKGTVKTEEGRVEATEVVCEDTIGGRVDWTEVKGETFGIVGKDEVITPVVVADCAADGGDGSEGITD